MLELFYPYIPEGVKEAVSDTLDSRWIGQGPKVDRFERDFAQKFGMKYCISFNSGSSALETAYELVGLSPGDEVICTPLTCTATNIPLLRMGVKIIWADVKEDTLCLDPEDALRKITPYTKCIVNVHLGGIENDLGKMPIPVVSDACQALGVFNGDYTCNSFQAIKHITTGDGGMLTVNNAKQQRFAKLKRWFGIDREIKVKNDWQCYTKRAMTFDIDILGYKRHMNDLAAAMGIVGLECYEHIIAHRRYLFNLYQDLLKDVHDITVVSGPRNTYWLCTVLVEDREDFAKMLFENEVDTNLVQVRNDTYEVFGGRVELPVMDRVESKYISLPLNMSVTIDDVYKVCELIKGGW